MLRVRVWIMFMFSLTPTLRKCSDSFLSSMSSSLTNSDRFLRHNSSALKRTFRSLVSVFCAIDELKPIFSTSPFGPRYFPFEIQRLFARTMSAFVDVQKSNGHCLTVFEALFRSPTSATVSIIPNDSLHNFRTLSTCPNTFASFDNAIFQRYRYWWRWYMIGFPCSCFWWWCRWCDGIWHNNIVLCTNIALYSLFNALHARRKWRARGYYRLIKLDMMEGRGGIWRGIAEP